ncbi:MAG: hypothetical protein ABSH36_07760 [Solirubrobacteraceae bacterium]
MAVTPASVLTVRLAAARGRGESFQRAWPAAFAAALQTAGTGEGREWAEAFEGTVDAWRGAFERRPVPRRERALHVLAEDPERVPCRDYRECAYCDGPIPEGRGRPSAPAKYCSNQCRKYASNARRVAA